MLKVGEGLNRERYNFIRGLIVKAGNDSEAAGVMLVAGVVQALGLLSF
jgi:hypothetical protein